MHVRSKPSTGMLALVFLYIYYRLPLTRRRNVSHRTSMSPLSFLDGEKRRLGRAVVVSKGETARGHAEQKVLNVIYGEKT